MPGDISESSVGTWCLPMKIDTSKIPNTHSSFAVDQSRKVCEPMVMLHCKEESRGTPKLAINSCGALPRQGLPQKFLAQQVSRRQARGAMSTSPRSTHRPSALVATV